MMTNENGILDHEGKCADEATTLLGTSRRNVNISAPKVPGCIAARHVLAILGFMGYVNVFFLRMNLSVAIVAMTDYTPNQNDTPVAQEECPGELNTTRSSKGTAETFSWDENTQGQILSAFFYGYIVTQIPGGWLADRFGGKWPFGLGVLCPALLTLLSPMAASAGAGWLIALRIFEGLFEGVTFPAIFTLMSSWAPPFERTKMMTIIVSGFGIGTILANAITGALCDSNFLGGWPSVFYLSGAMGSIWFIFWILLVHDSPAKHPRISQEEREYIERSIGTKPRTTTYIPIVAILTSIPVWANIISSFCGSWSSYTFLTNLPNYLKNILKFDITQSGLLSALPIVLNLIFTLFGGLAADFLREGRYLSTGATRKLCNSVGTFIPGIMTVIVGYVGCNRILAMCFICLAYAINGLSNSGALINQLDIAPQYAGIVTGFANTASSAAGFLAPTVVGVLTENNNTIGQWQIVFWICFVFNMISFVSFILMGSGEVQHWAKDGYSPLEADISDCDITKTDSEL